MRAKVQVSSDDYADWLKVRGIQIPNSLYKELQKDAKMRQLARQGKLKGGRGRKKKNRLSKFSSTNLNSFARLDMNEDGDMWEDDDMESSTNLHHISSSNFTQSNLNLNSSMNNNNNSMAASSIGMGLNFAKLGDFGGGDNDSDDGAGSEKSRKSHASAVSQAFSKYGISEKRSVVSQNALNVSNGRRRSISDGGAVNLFTAKGRDIKYGKKGGGGDDNNKASGGRSGQGNKR